MKNFLLQHTVMADAYDVMAEGAAPRVLANVYILPQGVYVGRHGSENLYPVDDVGEALLMVRGWIQTGIIQAP